MDWGTCVLLEGKAKHGDPLVGDGVEQGLDNVLREPGFLVVVHVNDTLPIMCDLGQVELLAYVHEVEDVLLKAGATKADARLEELGPDSRVQSCNWRLFYG